MTLFEGVCMLLITIGLCNFLKLLKNQFSDLCNFQFLGMVNFDYLDIPFFFRVPNDVLKWIFEFFGFYLCNFQFLSCHQFCILSSWCIQEQDLEKFRNYFMLEGLCPHKTICFMGGFASSRPMFYGGLCDPYPSPGFATHTPCQAPNTFGLNPASHLIIGYLWFTYLFFLFFCVIRFTKISKSPVH